MLGTWKMDQNSSQNKSEVYQTIDIVEPGTLTWQHMYSVLGNGDSGEGSVAAVSAVFCSVARGSCSPASFSYVDQTSNVKRVLVVISN